MQAVHKSVKELLDKIESLADRINGLQEEMEELRLKNKNLEERLNNCKAENQQLEKKYASASSKTGENTFSPDKESIRSEIEQYIEELDVCIDKLKKL